MGGKFHLKLNIGLRPIANKYHEGKVKRTLKRELQVPEITEREASGAKLCSRLLHAFVCNVSSCMGRHEFKVEDNFKGMVVCF